jgi:hypothetical protein
MTLGHSLSDLEQAGLVNTAGYDTFSQRVVFPLEANLYGRSIGNAAAHRFLPGAKCGLYGWERVKQSPEIILVEGLFDPAVLWQAGFRNVTCAIGSHLNARCSNNSVTAFPEPFTWHSIPMPMAAANKPRKSHRGACGKKE